MFAFWGAISQSLKSAFVFACVHLLLFVCVCRCLSRRSGEAINSEKFRGTKLSNEGQFDAARFQHRRSSNERGKKRSTDPNFWVRMSSSGVAIFHVKGWVPKSSVCSSKPRENKLFGGISRDFAGISQGHPKSLRKKVCVQFLAPIEWTLRLFCPRFSGDFLQQNCTYICAMRLEKAAIFAIAIFSGMLIREPQQKGCKRRRPIITQNNCPKHFKGN